MCFFFWETEKPKRAMVAIMAIIPNLGRFPGRPLRLAKTRWFVYGPTALFYLDSFPNTFILCKETALAWAFAIPANWYFGTSAPVVWVDV